MPPFSLVLLAFSTVVQRRYIIGNGFGMLLGGIGFVAWGLSDPVITTRLTVMYVAMGVAGMVLGVLFAYQQGVALLVGDVEKRANDLWDTVVQGMAPPSLPAGTFMQISIPGNVSHRGAQGLTEFDDRHPERLAQEEAIRWDGSHPHHRWLPAEPTPGAAPGAACLPPWFLRAFQSLWHHKGVDLRPVLPYTIEARTTLGSRSAHARLAAQQRLRTVLAAASPS